MKLAIFAALFLFGLVFSDFGYNNDVIDDEESMSYDEMLQVWEGVQGLLGKYVDEGNRRKLGRMISSSYLMIFNRNHAVRYKRFLNILSAPDSEEWFRLAPSKLVYQASQEAIVVEMVNSKGTTWQLWLKADSAAPGHWSIRQGTSTNKGNSVPDIYN